MSRDATLQVVYKVRV